MVRNTRAVHVGGGDSPSAAENPSAAPNDSDNFVRAAFRCEYFFAPKIFRAVEPRHFANFAWHEFYRGKRISSRVLRKLQSPRKLGGFYFFIGGVELGAEKIFRDALGGKTQAAVDGAADNFALAVSAGSH